MSSRMAKALTGNAARVAWSKGLSPTAKSKGPSTSPCRTPLEERSVDLPKKSTAA